MGNEFESKDLIMFTFVIIFTIVQYIKMVYISRSNLAFGEV